jgi:uncharacterized protein (TIGR01244 family)
MKRRYTLSFNIFTVFALICLYSASAQAQMSEEMIRKADITAFHQASPTLYTSAQPSKEALKIMAENGIKHVVSLRPASELDWNEQEWVTSLGMSYHAIPVAGASSITPENAAKLRTLLRTLEAQPTLLHCSSSNRVGGLRALIEFEDNGGDIDKAIDAGRQWGLTGLEDLVRKQLTNTAR